LWRPGRNRWPGWVDRGSAACAGAMSQAEAADACAREQPGEEGILRAREAEAVRDKETALRTAAERERDAAALRAAEAARRAAMARREAAEQRARAEAAEIEADRARAAAEEARARADEVREAASRIRAEIADVARQRNALMGSTSWRITAPLRAATGWLPAGLRGALRRRQ